MICWGFRSIIPYQKNKFILIYNSRRSGDFIPKIIKKIADFYSHSPGERNSLSAVSFAIARGAKAITLAEEEEG